VSLINVSLKILSGTAYSRFSQWQTCSMFKTKTDIDRHGPRRMPNKTTVNILNHLIFRYQQPLKSKRLMIPVIIFMDSLSWLLENWAGRFRRNLVLFLLYYSSSSCSSLLIFKLLYYTDMHIKHTLGRGT
jgi:hypothetical protein